MAMLAPKFKLSILSATALTLSFAAQTAFAGPDKMTETEPPAEASTEVMTDAPAPDTTAPEGTIIDITPDIQSQSTPETTIAETMPAAETSSLPGTTNEMMIAPSVTGYQCHAQEDGRTECVCATETECAAMEADDVCVTGTNWTSEEYGGCTQKSGAADTKMPEPEG